MDPTGRVVCFLIAFVFASLAALWDVYPAEGRSWRNINLGWAGFAAFVFPFLWDAWEAA